MLSYMRGMTEGIKFSASTHLYNKHMTDEYKKLLTKYNKIKKSKGRKK